jgi:DNA replication protein DnaC
LLFLYQPASLSLVIHSITKLGVNINPFCLAVSDKRPNLWRYINGRVKSHIATGLALEACRQCHRVRFYNAAALVNELILAQEQQRLPKFLTTALKQKLIVLDELGFIPFSTTGAQLMFQFCSTLHERVALIVTTNLKFADWTQVFGSEQLTAALLDRLTHRAHILEFIGESFRFRQRIQQQES